MSEIQAVLFDRNHWHYDLAMMWLHNHGFYPKKYHETKRFHRFRLINPKNCERLRTKVVGHHIEFIICFH